MPDLERQNELVKQIRAIKARAVREEAELQAVLKETEELQNVYQAKVDVIQKRMAQTQAEAMEAYTTLADLIGINGPSPAVIEGEVVRGN